MKFGMFEKLCFGDGRTLDFSCSANLYLQVLRFQCLQIYFTDMWSRNVQGYGMFSRKNKVIVCKSLCTGFASGGMKVVLKEIHEGGGSFVVIVMVHFYDGFMLTNSIVERGKMISRPLLNI